MAGVSLTLAQLKSIGTVGGAVSGLGIIVPFATRVEYTVLKWVEKKKKLSP